MLIFEKEDKMIASFIARKAKDEHKKLPTEISLGSISLSIFLCIFFCSATNTN
jgi:hypothetical protein